MDYRLELLDNTKFEEMITSICQDLLGKGVIAFAPGKDGGRDGKFDGKANKFPSESDPWTGKFILQAKHTANPIASCADAEFERLILKEEVPKIKRLKSAGDIDCYIIFTNRKYSGVSGEALLKKIKKETGLTKVVIIGKETLNNLYINSNKELIRRFELNKHHIPFDFSDEEIKEVILMFKAQLPKIEEELRIKVENVKYDFNHLEKEEKNKKNALGRDYYENVILATSLMDFDKIQHFLDLEQNSVLKDYYFDIASELNQIITVQRDDFGSFEEVFIFIYQKVCDGSVELKGSKRHVLTFLHYIYMECLIGIK